MGFHQLYLLGWSHLQRVDFIFPVLDGEKNVEKEENVVA